MKINTNHLKTISGLSVVLFCLIVFSGGFYNKIMKPGPYVVRHGRVYAIDPEMSGQTNREAQNAFLCNASMTLGVFLVAFSGKRLQNPVQAYRILMIGILLMGFGLIGSYYLLEMKRTVGPVTFP